MSLAFKCQFIYLQGPCVGEFLMLVHIKNLQLLHFQGFSVCPVDSVRYLYTRNQQSMLLQHLCTCPEDRIKYVLTWKYQFVNNYGLHACPEDYLTYVHTRKHHFVARFAFPWFTRMCIMLQTGIYKRQQTLHSLLHIQERWLRLHTKWCFQVLTRI